MESGQFGTRRSRALAPVWRSLRLLLLFVLLPGAGLAAATAGAGLDVTWFDDAVSEIAFPRDTDAIVAERHAALLEKAARQDTIPVIVRLGLTLAPEAILDVEEIRLQRDTLAGAQRRVLKWLTATASKTEAELGVKRFSLTPAFAIQADAQMLRELLTDPEVLDVVEDTLSAPNLAESVPLIGADASGTFAGRTGRGWVVAVLDTGVEKSHPFLAGKVVAEACYSTTSSAQGSTSLCPGGASSSTSSGSGLDCASNISGCGHGTHVAGIAAGNGSGFSGVAKDSRIIAIKVFSRFDGSANCGSSSPCVRAYQSDIIRGLEQVFALRSSNQIASVNLSLGGGRYTSPCDSDPRKAIIDQLRTAGIATVIASGNNSYVDSLGAPACISSAVSVGSTTKSDAVSSFSNSASFLSLLAPGSSINSSVLGGGFGLYSGTSMAAPHVAGAWAVLREVLPSASVANVLSALEETGQPVIDSRTGAQSRVKPRIQVDQAIAALIDPQPGYRLTVNSSGTSGVAISASPDLYGGTTNYTKSGIASGTSIVLTAPSTHGGNAFGSWSGCQSTSGTSCTVSMTSNKTVTANYGAAVTQLTNGQTVSGLSGSASSERHYYIDVPSGRSELTIEMWGGTGDADLYVRRVSQPTTSAYDCRPFYSSNDESCRFTNPAAGRYYIMVRGYSAYSGVSLRATSTGSVATYSLTVNASGATGVAISASPNLYGGTTNYTISGIGSGTSIMLTAPNSAGGATFSGWSGCQSTSGTSCTVSMTSNKTVAASYGAAVTQLTNGQTVSGLSGSASSERHYYIDVPSGRSELTIAMWGGTGDADLYVRRVSQPTTSAYDCRPFYSSNDESCRFTNPAAGRYYIMVRGYSAYSGVSLRASYSAASGWRVITGRVRLSDATPICAMVLANGQYMFSCDGTGAYRLNVPLDSNGEITLFAFADGFAPYRRTSGPEGFPHDAVMQPPPRGTPTIATTFDRQCSQPGWARIWGSIRAVTGAPLCAMVLANGQHMFSCQPVGSYALHVPLDSQGKITLFGFADGFQPYKSTFDASQCR